MNELYGRFLAVGFVVLRQAIDANDLEWAGKEIELLHNVPSLIDEPNVERHRYLSLPLNEPASQVTSCAWRELVLRSCWRGASVRRTLLLLLAVLHRFFLRFFSAGGGRRGPEERARV